jgi:uncharacterized protein YjbI with pentapeptide repeats
MFGRNAKPVKTPLDSANREWIERRWDWLLSQFGRDRMTGCEVVLPLARYFPDKFDGSPQDAKKLLDRVCDYMGIRSETVEMHFYQDSNPVHAEGHQQGTAGMYQEESGKYHVWIEVGNLGDAASMISTLSHEISHVHLLGHGRISSDEPDHEKLTDLLSVFLGMGVFAANSVIYEKYWESGVIAGWSIGRRGYLTMQEFGYALALFAEARAEEKPEWAKSLRPDVFDAYQKSRVFIARSEEPESVSSADAADTNEPEDLLHDIDEEDIQPKAISREELASRLKNGERDFGELSFQQSNLSQLDLGGCRFVGADFNQADLTNTNLEGCDLQDAEMQEAKLLRTKLRGAILRGVDFTSASMNAADLTAADIRDADITDAVLEGANLTATLRDRTTNLAAADISRVICDVDLSGERLSGTSHSQAIMGRYAKFADVVSLFFFICLAATIFGLAGGGIGTILDRMTGKAFIANVLSALGATLGGFMAVRILARRAKSNR